jgi:hypothetical protein
VTIRTRPMLIIMIVIIKRNDPLGKRVDRTRRTI